MDTKQKSAILSKINERRDLEAKINFLPFAPKALALTSKEIADHLSKLADIEDIYSGELLTEKGVLTDEAHDFILDEIDNNWDGEVKAYECMGYAGEFSVIIYCWNGIYKVSALEFDDIGYFLNLEDADYHALDIAESYPMTDESDD